MKWVYILQQHEHWTQIWGFVVVVAFLDASHQKFLLWVIIFCVRDTGRKKLDLVTKGQRYKTWHFFWSFTISRFWWCSFFSIATNVGHEFMLQFQLTYRQQRNELYASSMSVEPMLESTTAFFFLSLSNSLVLVSICTIPFIYVKFTFYGQFCVYLLSHGSFFCICHWRCCCCARQQIYWIELSVFFASQWISIQRWSVYSLPFVRCARFFPSHSLSSPDFFLHIWMNISKIHTLTNNDWMNSNVKTPHCSHHSSHRQKTILKTIETLTISLCVIAWVRLNEFIFSCYMAFFVLVLLLHIQCLLCASCI